MYYYILYYIPYFSTGCLETGEAIMGVTKTLMASNDTLFNFEDTLGEREDLLSPRACSQTDLNDNKIKEQSFTNNNKTSEDLISEALISLTTVTATSSDPLHETKHNMDHEIDNQHDDLNNKNFKNRMIKPKSFEGLSSFNDNNNGLTLSDMICSPEQPKSFSDYIDGGDTTYTTNTNEDRTCISVHQLKDDVIERISDISEPDWGISTISLSGKADLNNSLNDIPSLIEGLTNEEEEEVSDILNKENVLIEDSLDKASLNLNNTDEGDNIVILDIDSLEVNDDKSENENENSDNIIKDSLLHSKCNGDDENKENFNQENVNSFQQATMMHISGAPIETKVNNKQNDEKSMQQQQQHQQMNHQQQLPIETTTTINDNFLEKEIEYSSSQYYYKNNLANIISTNELTTIPIITNKLNNNNILLINNVPNLINNKNILNENNNYNINNQTTIATVPTAGVTIGRITTKPTTIINCLSNNMITDDNDNNGTTVILTSATTGLSASDDNEEQIIPNNYIRQKNYLMNINNVFNV